MKHLIPTKGRDWPAINNIVTVAGQWSALYLVGLTLGNTTKTAWRAQTEGESREETFLIVDTPDYRLETTQLSTH